MGTVFYAQGKYKEAIDKYNKAIAAYPEFAEAYYNEGLALQQLGLEEKNNSNRYQDAINSYNIALNLRPNYSDALNNKGIALLALNRSAQANEVFIKVRAMKLDSWIKVGIFIAFLILYALLLSGGYFLLGRKRISKTTGLFSINILGFFTLGWILAGYFSASLMIFFFGIGFLVIAAMFIAWSLLGYLDISLDTKAKSDNDRLFSFSISNSILIAAISSYPLIAAFGYFRYAIHSEQMSLTVFQFILIYIFIVSLFLTLPHLLGHLLSKNQNKEVRRLLLLFQSGYLAIISIFISFIIWSSEIATDELRMRLILILMLSVLLFGFLLPYFSGWQKSRSWRVYLLEKQVDWIDRLLDILDFPSNTLYTSKLESLQRTIESNQANFILP